MYYTLLVLFLWLTHTDVVLSRPTFDSRWGLALLLGIVVDALLFYHPWKRA